MSPVYDPYEDEPSSAENGTEILMEPSKHAERVIPRPAKREDLAPYNAKMVTLPPEATDASATFQGEIHRRRSSFEQYGSCNDTSKQHAVNARCSREDGAHTFDVPEDKQVIPAAEPSTCKCTGPRTRLSQDIDHVRHMFQHERHSDGHEVLDDLGRLETQTEKTENKSNVQARRDLSQLNLNSARPVAIYEP